MARPRLINFVALTGTAALFLLLGGCADKAVLSQQALDSLTAAADDAGGNLTDQASLVTDSHAVRELAANRTVQVVAQEYSKAMMEAGITVQTGMVSRVFTTPDGKTYSWNEQQITLVKYAPEPDFSWLRVSQQPSAHPFWGFANNVVDKSLYGFLGWVFGDTVQHLGSGKGDTYTNSPLIASRNQAGNDQGYTIGDFFTGDYAGTPAADVVDGLDENGWYMGIVGCSSPESFAAGMCSIAPEGKTL